MKMENPKKQKNIFLKRGLIVVMITTIVTGSIVIPSRANAFLGIGDFGVVHDPIGWLSEAGRFIGTTLKDIFLAKAKKALLDMISDQIIGWINGEGDPKFVTDPGGTLARIADNVIGQTIEESQLGAVCQPFSLKLKIGLGTAPRRFPERVSCTLGEVVSNFENFYDNFSEGGFPAFNRLLEPQNNFYGASIIGLEELNSRIGATQSQVETETLASEGYIPIKQCIEYTDKNGESTSNGVYDINDIRKGESDFENGIDSAEADAYQYVTQDVGLRCTRDETTTPGTLLAKGLEKSTYSDLDSIISAQDLTPYIGAILDAAIGRLIGAGAEGLKGIGKSGDGGFDTSTGDIRDTLDDYGEALDDVFLQSRADLLQRLRDLLDNLNDAITVISTARADNERLMKIIDDRSPFPTGSEGSITDDLIGCLRAKAVPPIAEILRWKAVWNDHSALSFTTLLTNISTFITETTTLRTEISGAGSFEDIGSSMSKVQEFLSRGEGFVREIVDIVDGIDADMQDANDAWAICRY